MEFPPEPWELRGQLFGAVWAVPRSAVPDVPPGVRPVVVAGRAWVVTAWVDYQPGGVLEYRELLAAVLGRVGTRPVATIVGIWVDSPASRAGGRALWGIPKELARFAFRHGPPFDAVAERDGGELARGAFTPRVSLPGRWPVRGTLAQRRGTGLVCTPAVLRGRVRLGRGRLDVDPDGPLGFLAGRTPVASFAVRDVHLVVGRR